MNKMRPTSVRYLLAAIFVSSAICAAHAVESSNETTTVVTTTTPANETAGFRLAETPGDEPETILTGEMVETQENRQTQTFLQDFTAVLTALFTKSPKDIFNALTTFVSETFNLPGAPYQLMLVMPSFLSPDRLYRMLNPFVLGPLANFCAALVASITVPMTAEYRFGDGPIGSTGVGQPVSRNDDPEELSRLPPELVYENYYRKPYRNPYNREDKDDGWESNSFIV